MQAIMENFGTIVLWMGVLDALVVLTLGITIAVMTLLGIDKGKFYERIVPAAGILVVTTIAAGIIMLLARWIASLLA